MLKDEKNNFRKKLKNPLFPIIILAVIIVIGTIGYYFLWQQQGATLLDALYMTVITITTVGFSEVKPLSNFGRIFTMFISIGGIGSLFYVLSMIMENLVLIQLQTYGGKKMLKKIEHLDNHVILVGNGRVGALAASELRKNNVDFVIVDDSLEENDMFADKNFIAMKGDATNDDMLIKAGIERARGMIVTTANPATTVFVVLSAKVLNPNLFIVARADDDTAVEKLKRAGAERVVNPYTIGGQRLVNLMINPNVIDFFEANFGTEDSSLNIDNIELAGSCDFIDKTLKDLDIRRKVGATILAVIRDGKPYPNPDGNFVIIAKDRLVALGTKEQLENLFKLTRQ